MSFNMGWQDISQFNPPTHVKTHNTVWLPYIISYINAWKILLNRQKYAKYTHNYNFTYLIDNKCRHSISESDIIIIAIICMVVKWIPNNSILFST